MSIMFQSWRLKVREAEEAAKHGRLDEAARLLLDGNLREFLPGQRLAGRVASEICLRSRRAACEGNYGRAWSQYDLAQQLVGEGDVLQTTRRELIETAEAQTTRLLEQNKPAAALEIVVAMLRRSAASSRLRETEEVARRLQSAASLANRGRFSDAAGQLSTAKRLWPELAMLDELECEYQDRSEQAQGLLEQLNLAMTDAKWTEVARIADELLMLAPEHSVARDAQRRAARQTAMANQIQTANRRRIEANSTCGSRASCLDRTELWRPNLTAEVAADDGREHAGEKPPAEPIARRNGNQVTRTQKQSNGRFLVWVDAVGGFLACTADEVTIGQAIAGNSVDIGVQADISRLHAKIRRSGEGYVLEALNPVWVQGRTVAGCTLLDDGDELRLGDSVRLRFRRPHALSASARLEMLSGHRFAPRVDSVLLMAESCVLGPAKNSHVVCRAWTSDVVLYRQDERLFCRAMESIEIDGRLCDGRSPVESNSRIVGSDFSLSLEALA